MKLTKKARQGLINSITAWEGKKKAICPDIDIYYESCPLCWIYYDRGRDAAGDGGCKGCPIALTTGMSECHGSPWREARDAYIAWEDDPEATILRAAFRRACIKM